VLQVAQPPVPASAQGYERKQARTQGFSENLSRLYFNIDGIKLVAMPNLNKSAQHLLKQAKKYSYFRVCLCP
jgi:hypothetical protein